MTDFRDERSARNDDESSSSGDEDSVSHLSFTHSNTGSGQISNREAAKKIKEDEELFKQESAVVFRLRLMVLFLLMVFAMIVSISIFGVTYHDNAVKFRNEYEERAKILVKSFATEITEHVQSLAVSTKDGTWPFQLIPNFQYLMTRGRRNTGILSVAVAPLVTDDKFQQWEDFVNAPENSEWIEEAILDQEKHNIDSFKQEYDIEKSRINANRTVDPLHYLNQTGHGILVENTSPFYLPVFESNPVPQTSHINVDMLQSWSHVNVSIPLEEMARVVFEDQSALLGGFLMSPAGTVHDQNPRTALFATLESKTQGQEAEYLGDPLVHFYLPVFDVTSNRGRRVVAVMNVLVSWRAYFANHLPQSDKDSIIVVLSNQCRSVNASDSFTYEVRGSEAIPLGYGDHHDPMFDEFRYQGKFSTNLLDDGSVSGIRLLDECEYQIDVYPTAPFFESFKTSTPITITMCTVLAFILVTFMFLFYDRLVEWRQDLMLRRAKQTAAILEQLFPALVRDRILQQKGEDEDDKLGKKKKGLKDLVDSNGNAIVSKDLDAPIADLFMNCTVCFMDIAGFTSWASTREPAHVFTLLQSIYAAFDDIADRRKVFKVETIGDSYMAVTGLPDPLKHHATCMVRFTHDCMNKMHEVVNNLEGSLGPGTSNLTMRIGLHSGPVTAGVLMGSRCRYQLFGDTVNTASRMESTGLKGKIQMSSVTAEILQKEGKGHWVLPREDKVSAKGKGMLQTWFLRDSLKSGPRSGTRSSTGSSSVRSEETPEAPQLKDLTQEKNDRLVTWVVSMLLADIKKLVSYRRAHGKSNGADNTDLVYHVPETNIPMDEVKDAIDITSSDSETSCNNCRHDEAEIDPDVIEDLKRFVSDIACRYRDNPFHNFEHACHVCMSVRKLLSRIVADKSNSLNLKIGSDPLASFAMTIGALIHDVDHAGVSNVQLGKENPELAEKYRDQSIAEQNSVDIAWELLMDNSYRRLRSYVFETQEELMRFRQWTVNIVLATDIFNSQLNEARKNRWNKAFSKDQSEPADSSGGKESKQHDAALRETIFIEHIIQASDVSHTMQHWHIYQKWNEKLFKEMYRAYKAGRMAKDPSTFWYQGELGFFDNYVIPLAKKMKDCGVFGVSSDEYLNYALGNRMEWEQRGQEMVERLKTSVSEE